jgi:hypothetical protein
MFILYIQGFQSGPVPGTFTRLRSCIVPAEITEPPKISGGPAHEISTPLPMVYQTLSYGIMNSSFGRNEGGFNLP